MRKRALLAILALALAPAPLWAAGPHGDGLGWAVWAALAVAVGLVPVLLWQRRQLRQSVQDALEADSQRERLAEILASAPDGFYRWDLDQEGRVGSEHCSRRLAVLLDLVGGTGARFPEVLDSFGPADAALLKAAVETLRAHGQGFEFDLALAMGNRRVLLSGGRAADAQGRPQADVIWMRDVTEGVVQVDRLSVETRSLTAERDRLRALVEALPMPVWLRSSDLSLLYCNQAYAAAVDAVSAETAVERGQELVPAALVREARALAARARAAQEPRGQCFHLVMGGDRKLVEIIETPLSAGVGEGLLTAGIAIDRTAHEEAEMLVERQAAAHAEVLEQLGTAIAIFGADTRLSFFNTAFCQLWGQDADNLATKPAYAALLESWREERRLPEVADFRAFRDGEVRRFTSLLEAREDLLHLPDERTLRRVVSPHPFGGLLFTYEDVTDALAMERLHNTSLAVHRETLDNLHEGIAVLASDGRLRLFNPAYGRIWNISAEKLAGHPHIGTLIDLHRDFFAKSADWSTLRQHLLGLFTNRISQRGRLERGDGSILDYVSVPLPDGAMLTTWLDVSDTARVELALRERNEALATADRLKSEFIANVSAEVRTPLSAVIGHSDMLANEYFGPLNSRQMEYASEISKAARHLGQVFSDILDLAAIEMGQMTLSLNAIDIHAMLSRVLTLTRERLREKRIRLTFQCPLDIGWMVADERRISQVLFNLLSNAVRFTAEAGTITLVVMRSTEVAGEEIDIAVSDSGHGLTEQDRAWILASFAGADPGPGDGHGAMLGLSLVRNFVKLHGGRVDYNSNAESGSTFILHLPAGSI